LVSGVWKSLGGGFWRWRGKVKLTDKRKFKWIVCTSQLEAYLYPHTRLVTEDASSFWLVTTEQI
jgi:hypothetical protein